MIDKANVRCVAQEYLEGKRTLLWSRCTLQGGDFTIFPQLNEELGIYRGKSYHTVTLEETQEAVENPLCRNQRVLKAILECIEELKC